MESQSTRFGARVVAREKRFAENSRPAQIAMAQRRLPRDIADAKYKATLRQRILQHTTQRGNNIA